MNENKFKILIDNFSPALLSETFQKSHDFFRVKQDLILINKNEKIIDIVQLGDFKLEDNTNIIVVSAKVLSPLSERSGRKNQYDIAKKILKDNPRYNAGIFVYYDNKGDFRMSLIYAEYLGTKVDYSTFRRFTYYVSKDQKNVTFIQQVSPFNFLNIKQLKDLFSVEKVTKEFFKKYHDLFIDTLEDFEKNEVFQNTVVKTNISTSPDFVKKMMGQIVFLYFVQKKGWLGVRPNENWGSGDQAFLRTLFTVCEKSNKNYFNDYLEPLFYKALAEKRGDDDFFQELNCRIPFLNGGLFESIYDWQNTTIYIPNKTIGNLLDFFDQYNFTVDENTPSDQEISVDPEMLGKIFENLLEVKDRKDKGAFYTPREIVHYMCRESLIQHLVSENTAPEERIRRIFEIKDTDLSVLIDGDKKTETIKKMKELKDIADKVDISLRNVKIVDPAVGSGAFPMGMLNEISSVRFYLNSNFLHKLNIGGKELSLYDIKKETLENCIYAVDIEPGAVEIAKLRFWLALVVEYESSDSNIAPPTLPNLDYKIMQGNSLLEEYEGVKLFDEKIIKTIDTDKEKQIDEIKEKKILIQKEYLNLNQKNELTLFKKAELDIEAKKLNERLKKLTQVDKNNIEKLGLFDLNKHKESKLKADELKSLQKQFFETNKKEGIKKQIEKLEWELIEATLKEEGKISELSKIEEFKKSKVKPFFLWKLHFADVFEQKGGFDIVIGNPPYNVDLTIKERSFYKENYLSVNSGRQDTAAIFVEKAKRISQDKFCISFIIPYRLFSRKRNHGAFQEYALGSLSINKIIYLGKDAGFDSAKDEFMILLFTKYTKNNVIKICDKLDFKELSNLNYVEIKQSVFEKDKEININISKYSSNILNKIEVDNLKLSTICEIKDGIVPYIRDKMLSKEKKDSRYVKFAGVSGTYKLEKYSFVADEMYLCYDLTEAKKYISDVKELRKVQLRDKEIFLQDEKIITSQNSSLLKGTIDKEQYFVSNSIHSTYLKKQYKEEYKLTLILACINSPVLNYYYNSKRLKGVDLHPQILITTLKLLPIPVITPKLRLITIQIDKLVSQVINLKKQNKDMDTKNFESQIDQLVYKLYDITPEEEKIIENSIKK